MAVGRADAGVSETKKEREDDATRRVGGEIYFTVRDPFVDVTEFACRNPPWSNDIF